MILAVAEYYSIRRFEGAQMLGSTYGGAQKYGTVWAH